MALAALVNIPFLLNNLVYFITERFFPKTREIGSLVVTPTTRDVQTLFAVPPGRSRHVTHRWIPGKESGNLQDLRSSLK